MNANEDAEYFIAGFKSICCFDKSRQVVFLDGYGVTIFFRVVHLARDVLTCLVPCYFPGIYLCHLGSLAVKCWLNNRERRPAREVICDFAIKVAGVAGPIKRVFSVPFIIILQDELAGQVLTRLTSDSREP